MEKIKNNKTLLVRKVFALAISLLMISSIFTGTSAQAATNPNSTPNNQNTTIPLVNEIKPNLTTANESPPKDETTDSVAAQWNGDTWEYSTDGGKTWSKTPPDGVKVGEKGSLTIGEPENFDMEAFQREIDGLIEGVEKQATSMMPEGYEGSGSFVRMGDTIARKTDNTWEYSDDGGETWTAKAPEGLEVSEDGSRIRIGGGDGDIEDFDVDAWLEEFWAGIGDMFTANRSVKGQGTAI